MTPVVELNWRVTVSDVPLLTAVTCICSLSMSNTSLTAMPLAEKTGTAVAVALIWAVSEVVFGLTKAGT